MSSPELVQRAEQPTAVVREKVPLAELPRFFGRAFGEVMGVVETQGVRCAGPPFAMFFGPPGETAEVEAGFPVERPVSDTATVHPGHLPGGRVVHTTHVGPYDALVRTYSELHAWMATQHLSPHREMWEVYLSDPKTEPDASRWRTEIFWPVD